MLGEKIAAHLRNLPPGQIAVDAIEVGRIVVELLGKRIEQMRHLQHVLHGVVYIAFQHNGGIGVDLVASAGVAARGHVVLHDLHGISILEAHARHLVEGDAIPQAHQTHAHSVSARTCCAHVAEEVRRRRLAARKQNGIGRHFFVHMGFARTARPQFAQIVVTLDEGHHTFQEMQTLSLGQDSGLVAGRPQEQRLPLLGREGRPVGNHLVEIEVGHLNRGQADHAEGRVLRTLLR